MIERGLSYAATGFSTGSLYVLVALGIVLIYRSTRVLNFAHGDTAVLITFVLYALSAAGMPFAIALLGALGTGALGAGLFYFGVLLPAERRGSNPTSQLILTLGLALVIQGGTGLIWGTEPKVLDFPLSDSKVVHWGPVVLSHLSLGAIGMGLVGTVALYLLVQKTKVGLALRALSQDLEGVQTLGIPTQRLLALGWGLSAFLGGAAGIFLAPTLFVDPYFMLEPFLKGFAAAVLGGLNSLPGAVVGGLVLGVSESLFSGFVSIKYKATFAFGIILVILLFRPEGLLGKPFKERV